MADKNQMLARIRKALGGPIAGGPAADAVVPRRPFPKFEGFMPPIAPEDQVPRFEMEFKKVGGSPHGASTWLELEGVLRAIVANSQTTSTVLTRNLLLKEINLAETMQAWGMSVTIWPEASRRPVASHEPESEVQNAFRDHCFLAGIGISGVDFVLAETGSLVLSSQTEGSQLATLTPPIHVALYRRDQVFGSLDDILEQIPLSTNSGPTLAGRSIVFITGPSRTGDIEQILIRGVHGPGEVHAILVEDSCLAELSGSSR